MSFSFRVSGGRRPARGRAAAAAPAATTAARPSTAPPPPPRRPFGDDDLPPTPRGRPVTRFPADGAAAAAGSSSVPSLAPIPGPAGGSHTAARVAAVAAARSPPDGAAGHGNVGNSTLSPHGGRLSGGADGGGGGGGGGGGAKGGADGGSGNEGGDPPDGASGAPAGESLAAAAVQDGGQVAAVPARPPLDAAEAFRRDVAARPDHPDASAYEAMPVGGFGAALLRAMGFTGDLAASGDGDGEESTADGGDPPRPVPRPPLLGLGASLPPAEPPRGGSGGGGGGAKRPRPPTGGSGDAPAAPVAKATRRE
ncbi:hypothetical protein MMPV_005831 [Pyropia vietnamensis]